MPSAAAVSFLFGEAIPVLQKKNYKDYLRLRSFTLVLFTLSQLYLCPFCLRYATVTIGLYSSLKLQIFGRFFVC